MKPRATGAGVTGDSLAGFLLLAFGFGLASIFTPCVFPMIPITMSYFMNKQGSVRQAVTFCLGIIVLFSGIGLVVTAALGPVGVVALGQSAWVNGFIAVLFVVFGLSLLGAFEITIPSSILTRLNQSSEKGGLIGTLLMGLTFALASFACVGPFMGALLAGSISGRLAAAAGGHGGIRHRLGAAVLSAGAVSLLPPAHAAERRLAGARQGGDGLHHPGVEF